MSRFVEREVKIGHSGFREQPLCFRTRAGDVVCTSLGIEARSVSGVGQVAPGRIRPPTNFRNVVPPKLSAMCQRSIASDNARLTRCVIERRMLRVEYEQQVDQPGALV